MSANMGLERYARVLREPVDPCAAIDLEERTPQPQETPPAKVLSMSPEQTAEIWSRRSDLNRWPADYELSLVSKSSIAKPIESKQFNNFPPARKRVLATLITLALVESDW